MATHVISFFTDVNARASFENHRRYCARQGYAHEYVGASAIGWLQMRMILKYQVLLRTLRACAEGDLADARLPAFDRYPMRNADGGSQISRWSRNSRTSRPSTRTAAIKIFSFT
jgi:hypothetical protein